MRPRARNSPHGAGGLRKEGKGGIERVPRAAMGYSCMSKEDKKTSGNPSLVMLDEESGSNYARPGRRTRTELAHRGCVRAAQGMRARRGGRRRIDCGIRWRAIVDRSKRCDTEVPRGKVIPEQAAKGERQRMA